jgi:hypothetical protein
MLSPVLVDQEIFAVPGPNKVSFDTRPVSLGTGVQVVSVSLENSMGSCVVERADGSLTSTASTRLEVIVETVVPKATPVDQTEPAR